MNDGDSRNQDEVAVFAFLERGFAELATPASPDQLLALARLVSLLSAWASRINLTGHRSPLEMAGRLVLDAAALSECVPELRSGAGPQSGKLADLGSGAGFPGLPLAILNPDLDVFLVDSRLKRNHFQREAKRRLGLERVTSILGRSDQVDPVECDLVVAQAMTQPEKALELMIPWACDGGVLILPASDAAKRPEAPASVEPLELRFYTVPVTGVQRRLWITRAKPRPSSE